MVANMMAEYLVPNCGCIQLPAGVSEENEEAAEVSSSSTTTDEDGEGEPRVYECDYEKDATRLYLAIEKRQWEEVLYFLVTGKWYNSTILGAFGSSAATSCVASASHLGPSNSPKIQTRTWVTARDKSSGKVRWCHLPIHAAITFEAPLEVIKTLLDVYPKSIRCSDDQRMLPLHYGFRFGSDDETIAYLIEQFPAAVKKRSVKNRLPIDYAKYGPRPQLENLLKAYSKARSDTKKSSNEERDKAQLEKAEEIEKSKSSTWKHPIKKMVGAVFFKNRLPQKDSLTNNNNNNDGDNNSNNDKSNKGDDGESSNNNNQRQITTTTSKKNFGRE